ncbi:MAG: alpha/beta hydrolase [Sphingorhabdus sp.]
MFKKILLGLLAAVAIAFIALFAWGYAPDIPLDELKAKYANAESEFVDLGDGLIVHLRDEGPKDAPAIILLHGSNASLHTWDGWVDRLKGTYRIIRFDLAGHGLTGPHPEDCYSSACNIDAVDKVASERGLTKFTLAGNSMGGNISYMYARAHPGRLEGLILVDPSGAPAAKKPDLPIGFRIAMMPGINRLARVITPRSMIEKSLSQSVSNQAVVTDENVDLYWNLLRRAGNREATAKRFANYATRRQVEPLAASPVPTLVLWGKEDKLINVGAAPWFAKQFSGSKTIIYDGIGHLPMEEVAGRSADDVKAWIGEQTAGSVSE